MVSHVPNRHQYVLEKIVSHERWLTILVFPMFPYLSNEIISLDEPHFLSLIETSRNGMHLFFVNYRHKE